MDQDGPECLGFVLAFQPTWGQDALDQYRDLLKTPDLCRVTEDLDLQSTSRPAKADRFPVF